jgi:hypothetical protein
MVVLLHCLLIHVASLAVHTSLSSQLLNFGSITPNSIHLILGESNLLPVDAYALNQPGSLLGHPVGHCPAKRLLDESLAYRLDCMPQQVR